MAQTVHIGLLCLTVCAASGYVLPSVRGAKIESCPGINIISRAQWGARTPKNTTDIKVPVPEFFVHHTDTKECFNVSACSGAVRGIQKYHMDYKGWYDIGYNFLVGEDGNVYEGRGWTHVGAQTKGYNYKSFGTSVIGNYMTKLPNEKALSALKGVIQCGLKLGKLSADYRLYGHRDAGKTDCPGDTLYKEIQTWPHYSHEPPLQILLKNADGVVIHDN